MVSNQPSSSNSAPDTPFIVFDEDYVSELRARFIDASNRSSKVYPVSMMHLSEAERQIAESKKQNSEAGNQNSGAKIQNTESEDQKCEAGSQNTVSGVLSLQPVQARIESQDAETASQTTVSGSPSSQIVQVPDQDYFYDKYLASSVRNQMAKSLKMTELQLEAFLQIRRSEEKKLLDQFKKEERDTFKDDDSLNAPDLANSIGVNGNSKGSAEGDGLSQYGSPSMHSGHIPNSSFEGFHGDPFQRNGYHGPPQPDGSNGKNLAPPDVPDCTKEWHHTVTENLRNHLVGKLVKAIFPEPYLRALSDNELKDLIAYARTVEKEIFESANDREQYYHLLAETIYKIQKELQESRLSTQGAAPHEKLEKMDENVDSMSSRPTTAAGCGGGSSMLKEEDPMGETSNQAPESVKDVKSSEKPSVLKNYCKETATDSNSRDTLNVDGFVFHENMISLLARLTAGNGNQNSEIREKRTVYFSSLQSQALEHQFTINKHLTPAIQAELARITNLTEEQVKIWFQDRRYRQKREENNEHAKKARFVKFHCKETNADNFWKETTFGISKSRSDASELSRSFEASKLPEGFSRQQVDALERNFILIQFPPRFHRKRLAESIGLKESQVKTWFKNRRREEEDKEDESDSDCGYGLMEKQPNVEKEKQGWYKVAREISDFCKMMVPVALLIFLVCMIFFMLTALFK